VAHLHFQLVHLGEDIGRQSVHSGKLIHVWLLELPPPRRGRY
jgi:hypothetical protein